MGFVRHLDARERPAQGASTNSDEGLWQARLRFRQRARNFQAVQNLQTGQVLVRAAVYYRARTDRASGSDRLRRLRFLQQPTRAMNRPPVVALGRTTLLCSIKGSHRWGPIAISIRSRHRQDFRLAAWTHAYYEA